MTIFARSLPCWRALRPPRRPILASVLVAVALALLAASPAGALVSKVETHPGQYDTVGLQPRNVSYVLDGELGASFANSSGNPVVHGNSTYMIYWDPDDEYFSEWQTLINNFVQGMGAESGALGNVFAVDAQYTDKTNQPAVYKSTLKVTYIDDAPYPTTGNCTDVEALIVGAITCLTDKQIQEQLKSFIAEEKLPTGMGSIYYLLTPPGVTVCVDEGGPTGHCSDFAGTVKEVEAEEVAKREAEENHEGFTEGEPLVTFDDSFCSYHSDINPDNTPSGDANTILYAVIPWTAGGLGSAEVFPRLEGYDCQDGGFDPQSKPPEKREQARERSKKEKEAEKEADQEEKDQDKTAEELEGPHEEEPNQLTSPGADGAWDTGLADLIVNQIAVEQQNVVTDPLLNAWQGSGGLEATDECRNFFAGGVPGGSVTANEETRAGTLSNQVINGTNYYLNLAFNDAALKLPYNVPCIGGVELNPRFTSPDPVDSGVTVGFDGMESGVSLNAGVKYSAGGSPEHNYATYTWNFGDGTPTVSGYAPGAPVCEEPWLSPCAGSVFHAYQYGGTYEVTLTITDIAGNTNTVTHPITVIGPPPPSPGGSEGSGGSGGSGSGSAGTPGSSSPAAPSSSAAAPAAPVLAATIAPQSLRSAARKGLVVRYSVNEQVAGRFEVLLSRAVAHRLGISGPPATGLPAGSPSEVVIAQAVLVTTKGGHSSVHIHFSKRTAARLARARQVSLMLWALARGSAASGSPAASVVSVATLRR